MTTPQQELNKQESNTDMSDVDIETTTDVVKPDAEEPQQPLWPKTPDEYGWAALDMGVIGMVIAGLTGKCPAIPSLQAFLVAFAVATLSAAGLKFAFSWRRPNQDKLYPRVKGLVDFLGIAQLGIGVWGMALIFPNIEYLGDPSPETCEMGPLIATLIPSCIIAIVIIGLLGMGVLYLLGCKRSNPDDQGVEEKEAKLESTEKAVETA